MNVMQIIFETFSSGTTSLIFQDCSRIGGKFIKAIFYMVAGGVLGKYFPDDTAYTGWAITISCSLIAFSGLLILAGFIELFEPSLGRSGAFFMTMALFVCVALAIINIIL